MASTSWRMRAFQLQFLFLVKYMYIYQINVCVFIPVWTYLECHSVSYAELYILGSCIYLINYVIFSACEVLVEKHK